MLQAELPAGHHVIELHYWPDTFNAGLCLSACSAAGLLVAAMIATSRRRARVRSG